MHFNSSLLKLSPSILANDKKWLVKFILLLNIGVKDMWNGAQRVIV